MIAMRINRTGESELEPPASEDVFLPSTAGFGTFGWAGVVDAGGVAPPLGAGVVVPGVGTMPPPLEPEPPPPEPLPEEPPLESPPPPAHLPCVRASIASCS